MPPENTKFLLQLVLDRCTREAIARRSKSLPTPTPTFDISKEFSPELAAKFKVAEKLAAMGVRNELPVDFKVNWCFMMLTCFFKLKGKMLDVDPEATEFGQAELDAYLEDPISSAAFDLQAFLTLWIDNCPRDPEMEMQINSAIKARK